MDELEGLASTLGGSFGGGGGEGGDSSTTTATSGGQITANTDIDFGSGSIDDSPSLTNTPATISQPALANQPASSAVYTPVQYPTAYNTLPGTSASTAGKGKLPLIIGGLVIAGIAVYIISQHKA